MEHFELNLESDFKFDDIVIALGNFDGIHIGHQMLISKLNYIKSKTGYKTSVFLFKNHSKDFISTEKLSRLMSFCDKLKKFENYNLNYAFSMEFSDYLKNLNPKEFLDFLVYKLNVKHIVVGNDYRFGKNRKGNTEFIKSYMKNNNLSCSIEKKICFNNIDISSTKIIEYIKLGKVDFVLNLLGNFYSIKGNVILGFQRGRILGYPTANLELSFNYVLPKEGVYFTKTVINNKNYYSFSSIGNNPTFSNKKITIESHIFDFDEDIYGKNIELIFLKRLRDNIKFDSTDKLLRQLKEDEKICRNLIENIK